MNLTETIQTLRTELLKANGTISTLTGERDGLTTKVTELTGQITELTGQVTTLTGERDEAQRKLKVLDGKVDEAVIDRIGEAGVPAITRIPEAKREETPGGKELKGRDRVAAAFTAELQKNGLI